MKDKWAPEPRRNERVTVRSGLDIYEKARNRWVEVSDTRGRVIVRYQQELGSPNVVIKRQITDTMTHADVVSGRIDGPHVDVSAHPSETKPWKPLREYVIPKGENAP